jgi:hypothetical protein
MENIFADLKAPPLAPFVLHDLRRSGRTGIARLGVSPFIAERVLNHITGEARSVRATYDV